MPRWQTSSKRLFVERLESRLLLTAAPFEASPGTDSSQPETENEQNAALVADIERPINKLIAVLRAKTLLIK